MLVRTFFYSKCGRLINIFCILLFFVGFSVPHLYATCAHLAYYWIFTRLW